MDWKPYKSCCYAAAAQPNAAYCTTCRNPLLRCHSFSECAQLLEPLKPCPVCLSPELVIEAGATVNASVGDSLALPLLLRNQSAQVDRPLWVKSIYKREGGGEPESLPLDWNFIDAGSERQFVLEAGPFDAGGMAKVDVLLVIASRAKEGFEEAYLFGGTLLFNVSHHSQQQVVQNINLSGAHFETGGLVKTDLRSDQLGTENRALTHRQVVSLQRFETLELTTNIRGDPTTGIRVPRHVRFECVGFSESDAPRYAMGAGPRGMLAIGRADRRFDAETNPYPNDIVARVYQVGDTLDEAATLQLSRHHFDLLLVNDRLNVFVRSGKGVLVNDQHFRNTSVVPLHDGDIIAPVAEIRDRLSLKIRFQRIEQELVRSVVIQRLPHFNG